MTKTASIMRSIQRSLRAGRAKLKIAIWRLLILLILIIIKYKKTFKNEQRNRDDTAKKRVNTSGVGESNYYY